MIRKIFTICFVCILIISLSGCSEKNSTNKFTNDSQKNMSQDNNSTKKEDDETSSKKAVESVSTKNETLPDYFSQKDKILLVGKINNELDIHMELKITNKDHFDDVGELYWNPIATMTGLKPTFRYEGFYYYDKYQKNIRVEAETYSNGYLAIYEFDENNNFTNSFGGFLDVDNVLKGTWSNHKGTNYQFYLAQNTTKVEELNLNFDTNKIGEYYTLESHKGNFTCLNIVAASDKKFKFHISGYSRPNLGNVGGVAYYTDTSKKQAIFKDEEYNTEITFSFEDKAIKVSINGNTNYAGAHVKMDGTFKKNETNKNLSAFYLGDD